MKNKSLRFPRIPIKLGDSAGPNGLPVVPERVQLIRTGSFYDARYGEFPINKSTLASFVKNFEAQVRGVDLAIDYAHENDQKAAGWIKRLELADDGNELWAHVKWTPSGNQVLADGEFRYLSAEFNMDYEDNESRKKFGPTLLGAGLTNRPVIKGMEPVIELHEKGAKHMTLKELLAAITAAEEAKDTKKVEELKAALAKLAESDHEKEIEAKNAEIKRLADEVKALAAKKAASGGDDGDEDDDEDAGKGKKSALKKKMAKYEEEMADMKKKLAGYEDTTKAAEVVRKFDKMLAEGKVVEAQRESFIKGDTVRFSELAQPVKLNKVGHSQDEGIFTGAEGAEKMGKDAQAEVLKLAEKLVDEKKFSDIGDAIAHVLTKNPDLNRRYMAETQAS